MRYVQGAAREVGDDTIVTTVSSGARSWCCCIHVPRAPSGVPFPVPGVPGNTGSRVPTICGTTLGMATLSALPIVPPPLCRPARLVPS